MKSSFMTFVYNKSKDILVAVKVYVWHRTIFVVGQPTIWNHDGIETLINQQRVNLEIVDNEIQSPSVGFSIINSQEKQN